MVTLIVSLYTRAKTLSLTALSAASPVMTAMIAGAMIAAFFGTSYVKRLSEKTLERIILVLPYWYRLGLNTQLMNLSFFISL